MSDSIIDLIKSLTPEQRKVLDAIAINFDEGHDEAICLELEKLELIEFRGNTNREGQRQKNPFSPLWLMPIPVHIKWCALCAEELTAEEEAEAAWDSI